MDLLPEKIKRKGFTYELEKRGNKALMYRQIDDEDGILVAYEVFKIKVDPPKTVFGIPLNEREVFPANEDFGKWAWSCSTKDKAEKRFQDLENSLGETEVKDSEEGDNE